jgi:DNA-binding NarL/FixJ family response regulator
MSKIKILILEDNLQIADELFLILNQHDYDIKMVKDYKESLEMLKKHKPEIAICKMEMGKSNASIDFATDAYLIHPKTLIIYACFYPSNQILNQMNHIHTIQYIYYPWDEIKIKNTVQLAIDEIEKNKKKESLLAKLSGTEYKVVDLISKKKKSKEIADILFIAEKTVRNHRYNIIKKLQLPNHNNSLLKWALMYLRDEVG